MSIDDCRIFDVASLCRFKKIFSKDGLGLIEADESYFWLEFIIDENMIKNDLVDPLFKEADELTAIFITSRRTARKNG